MESTIVRTLETASVGYPITRAGVSLFPVYLHQPPLSLDYLPGVAALASKEVEFAEFGGGNVPHLRVMSRSARPVLIPEGDTLVGGLQNRTLNVTILLSAGFDGAIPVSCVEAGRWGRHRGFAHGGAFAPRRVRREKTRSVAASMAMDGGRVSDQRAVWREIDGELDRQSVRSDTRAIHDAYKQTARLVGELAAAGPLPGQNGVVASLGRRIVAAEVFDRPETLAAYWRAIVEGLAFDAGQEYPGRPSATAALRFLHGVAHADRVEAPGADLGIEVRFRSPRLEAQGLRVDGTLVHLSAFAA